MAFARFSSLRSFLTTHEDISFLRARVPLFAGFTEQRLAGLVGGSLPRLFEANAANFRTGAQGFIDGIQSEG